VLQTADPRERALRARNAAGGLWPPRLSGVSADAIRERQGVSESVSSYLVVDFWSVLTDRARLEGSDGGTASRATRALLSRWQAGLHVSAVGCSERCSCGLWSVQEEADGAWSPDHHSLPLQLEPPGRLSSAAQPPGRVNPRWRSGLNRRDSEWCE
jgi:hypothetical protein